jgi:hypothetical protein
MSSRIANPNHENERHREGGNEQHEEEIGRVTEARHVSTRSAIPEFTDLFSKLCMGRSEPGDRDPER